MYRFLDIFFVVFHTSLVAFNLTGWIWKKTRRLHLITIGLTVLSWVGLGLFFGWGYCPSTDWHWDVKRKLGETDLPYSYVTYYLDQVSGMSWDPATVDILVTAVGLTALALSIWLNIRDSRRSRITHHASP